MSEVVSNLENILKFLKENNYNQWKDIRCLEMLIGCIKHVSSEECKQIPYFMAYDNFAVVNKLLLNTYLRSEL
jgi:hypothetical protein